MKSALSIRLVCLCTAALLAAPVQAQLTPQEAAAGMARGINLGNTLEPEQEGGWNNGPAQQYFFDDYVAAGFTNVRIPIRWDKHTGSGVPFTVSASWMTRVEQVIDWGLSRGLYVIINGHHEDWLKTSYANAASRARYDSIWAQISTRFKDKSERLLFEIMNEPMGMTRAQVDEMNARILGIIRKTNPTRIVIIAGNDYSGVSQLVAAAVPNDKYLMGTFHSYDPWFFAGEGRGTWGTDADRNNLRNLFNQAGQWSTAKKLPVTISEFGVVKAADYNSRMALFAAYVDEALSRRIPFQVWDDGGNFGLYQRGARQWDEVKDILIHETPDSPTRIAAIAKGDTAVVVSWSRRGGYDSVRIDRSTTGGAFTPVGETAGDAASFTDRTVRGGTTYTYRVVAVKAGQADRPSYPHRLSVVSTGTDDLPTLERAFDLYPNPASGEFVLALKGPAFERALGEIYDALGRRVRLFNLESAANRVEINNLAGGLYLVRVVESGRGTVARTLVVR